MPPVKLGDYVQINYHRVPNPHVGSASRTCEFTVGSEELAASISIGVVGMNLGEQKQLTLPPEEAFGLVQPKLIQQIPRKQFPTKLALKVGKRLTAMNSSTGLRRRVTILEITSDSILVDGNHPSAGKDVVVEVTLVSISAPSAKKRNTSQQRISKFDLEDSK